ncbi:MAG: DUF4466 family protein [Chitinophagaceae bacterium]
MKRKSLYFNYSLLLVVLLLAAVGCKKETYSLPIANTTLQNTCIKRTLGPNIVGLNIDFAYAMALAAPGKIVSAQVEASIPGGAKTYMENRSFYTNASGVDVGITVGSPSVNDGAKTTVTFTKDTMAATLRYFYAIPEAARGKSVSFTFTAKSSEGATVSFPMGPYTVAKMDMALNLRMRDGDSSYLSITDMAVYTSANVAAHAGNIDLVYLYRSTTPLIINHALVAPAADPQYLPGVTLPAGVNKTAKIQKVFSLQDFNLAHLQFGIYIDDLDFQKLDMTGQPNFAINLKLDAGAWVETADGKYRAYVYFNSVDNTNKAAVISIKRYVVEGK